MARKKHKKQKGTPGQGSDTRLICKNRRAHRDFAISEKLEAGVVLQGTEVKACREGKANLNDAYVMVHHGNAELIGAHIAEYSQGNQFNHEPTRTRRLLLHSREIEKLATKVREKGFVAVPLSMYFKSGWAKLEIGIGKGRTHEDKRERVKEREVKREMERAMRRRR